MSTRSVQRWSKWLEKDAVIRERTERLEAAFGPYRRDRPRDPETAALLRERGVPERLIGPVTVRGD